MNENVYFKARKRAAAYNDAFKSREGASEALGIHPSTLASYELNTVKSIPVESVVMMADQYNAPELLNHYCKYECPIGKCREIVTEHESLERTAIGLVRALNVDKVREIKRSLLDIAHDGKVSEDERDELLRIIQQLSDFDRGRQELELMIGRLEGGSDV